MNLFGNETKKKRIVPKPPKNSKPYFPSNGTEGMSFESENCNRCTKENKCTILRGAYNGREPKQWVTTNDGKNICISLKSF